jgi:hypothetical protein
MFGFIKNIWAFVAQLAVRPAFWQFIREHYDDAIEVVKIIRSTYPAGTKFAEIHAVIFRELKDLTGSDKENWVAGLAFFVIEALKAREAKQ